jgi:hypothetical protein
MVFPFPSAAKLTVPPMFMVVAEVAVTFVGMDGAVPLTLIVTVDEGLQALAPSFTDTVYV